MSRNEQLGKGNRVVCVKPRTWAWLKRETRKRLRREGKRLLDEAPQRVLYRGFFA